MIWVVSCRLFWSQLHWTTRLFFINTFEKFLYQYSHHILACYKVDLPFSIICPKRISIDHFFWNGFIISSRPKKASDHHIENKTEKHRNSTNKQQNDQHRPQTSHKKSQTSTPKFKIATITKYYHYWQMLKVDGRSTRKFIQFLRIGFGMLKDDGFDD